mmetsp:Transcript_63275/g.100456  ORF Transcript_63275/g.100456 Transcript_63275/m.100456 type:complete len:163 (+) Transcript_63275:37-525(+)
MGSQCCCSDKKSTTGDEVVGPEVSMKSAWFAKVDEQDLGASDAVNPRAAESQVLPENFTSLEERLEGVWSRKDDGKPLGEIAQGQLTWDAAVLVTEEPCQVQISGQDLVKITIRDHDFYGRVFFSITGDAAMICWTDGEIWQKQAPGSVSPTSKGVSFNLSQ